MRTLTNQETWEMYFKDKYITKEVMQSNFYIQIAKDKTGEFKNKKYLVPVNLGNYYYSDIVEYLKYQEEVHNTIVYAEQLIVDLEAIFDHVKIKGWKTKFIKNIGVAYQEFTQFTISYNYAVKFIAAVERVVRNMSSEGRRELIMLMEEVKR